MEDDFNGVGLSVRDIRSQAVYPCAVGVALVVGRRAKNARVDIACDSKHVSRRHCELRARADGTLEITDSSAHGTFVNGAKLEGEGVARPGDTLVLGHDYTLVVVSELDPDATTAPELAADAPPPWRPAVGRLGERYRLVRELGRGGMGVVYEAWDEARGRPCAVKRLLSGLSSPRVEERFRREALLGERLGGHPSLVTIYDSGTTPEGDLYYAMDLVEGAPLAQRVAAGIDRRDAVRLVAATARAVAVAHERGVIHRDLKPENVLVTREGLPVVVDLGVSKALDEGNGLTATGSLLGTPGYMAPEQVEDAKRATTASDVYALGAVLYFVLVREPPCKGADLAAVLSRVLRGDIAPPRSHDPTVDPRLDDLCRRTLALDPRHRPASAAAFAEELEAWLHSK